MLEGTEISSFRASDNIPVCVFCRTFIRNMNTTHWFDIICSLVETVRCTALDEYFEILDYILKLKIKFIFNARSNISSNTVFNRLKLKFLLKSCIEMVKKKFQHQHQHEHIKMFHLRTSIIYTFAKKLSLKYSDNLTPLHDSERWICVFFPVYDAGFFPVVLASLSKRSHTK